MRARRLRTAAKAPAQRMPPPTRRLCPEHVLRVGLECIEFQESDLAAHARFAAPERWLSGRKRRFAKAIWPILTAP